MLRKLPIGVQGFEKIRDDNFVYVDKTAYVYRLVHSVSQGFLSRPRRFGKSLLLSTLKAYWEGKRDFFEGLDIVKLEEGNPDAWQEYPIFYFDFNRDNYHEANALDRVLDLHLQEWEAFYGEAKPGTSLAGRFQYLIKKASEVTGHMCVVLIDEYDKPLLDVVDNRELAEYNKAVFKGFFSTLKSYDSYLRFVFITGVTKFSKVSIFSGLNHLDDISMVSDYAEICGITQEELGNNFQPEIARLAKEQELSVDECINTLKKRYGGYLFHYRGRDVYNPFSLLKCFASRDFGDYWYETGTPSFLVKRLRQRSFDVRRFSNRTILASSSMLSSYHRDQNPISLLYQTGYLTLNGYYRQGAHYTLGFPNEEVEYGFLNSLLFEYMPDATSGSGKDILSIKLYLEKADTDALRDAFISLFAGIPYTDTAASFEHDFQSVIYIVFTLLGQYVHAEVHSARGRADCVVETSRYIYVFEFKRDKSAAEALMQIEEMGYALPYAADTRELIKVGANFDSSTRMLSDWEIVRK